MIRYSCPRCKKSLESPVSFAGQKLHCPDCNQRLQIPQPSTPPPPPVNKTILATEEPAAPAAHRSPLPEPPAVPEVVEVVEEAPSRRAPAPSGRREICLECGADVTERARVQTCSDCGSLLCSAMCYREHRYHAHSQRKRRPRNACPYCGSMARPYYTTVISQGGWTAFFLLLVFFFPLCWIGLLMTETQMKCDDCGARLD
jgi:DNA-directed RNA polymerase subunit RPC12/RpoP